MTLFVAVPVVAVVVLLLVLRGTPLPVGKGRSSWRIHSRQWLALALFFWTFAAGDFLVFLIDGGFTRHLLVIVPSALAGASFMWQAKSTRP